MCLDQPRKILASIDTTPYTDLNCNLKSKMFNRWQDRVYDKIGGRKQYYCSWVLMHISHHFFYFYLAPVLQVQSEVWGYCAWFWFCYTGSVSLPRGLYPGSLARPPEWLLSDAIRYKCLSKVLIQNQKKLLVLCFFL